MNRCVCRSGAPRHEGRLSHAVGAGELSTARQRGDQAIDDTVHTSRLGMGTLESDKGAGYAENVLEAPGRGDIVGDKDHEQDDDGGQTGAKSRFEEYAAGDHEVWRVGDEAGVHHTGAGPVGPLCNKPRRDDGGELM